MEKSYLSWHRAADLTQCVYQMDSNIYVITTEASTKTSCLSRGLNNEIYNGKYRIIFQLNFNFLYTGADRLRHVFAFRVISWKVCARIVFSQKKKQRFRAFCSRGGKSTKSADAKKSFFIDLYQSFRETGEVWRYAFAGASPRSSGIANRVFKKPLVSGYYSVSGGSWNSSVGIYRVFRCAWCVKHTMTKNHPATVPSGNLP